MRFEFATATRIVFGAGAVSDLAAMVKSLGERPLVVVGRDAHRAEKLIACLRTAGLGPATYSISGEPELAAVENGITAAQSARCDCVIGLGGGSVIDAAKAIAAMLTNPGELLDYLEIVGRGKTLTQCAAPIVAIPTTAGTGAEVTRNSVLASPAHRLKVSLRSPHLLPRVALVDPELTYDLPPALTANTGLDALTQLIEPYVCLRANPMTDAFCVDGIRRVASSLRVAVATGHHAAAREDMAVASLFGGLALANAGLGAVHGFAGPIGGMFPAPHGAVCAALLPGVIAMNLRALRQRTPASQSLPRYEHVARLLTGRPTARAEDGVTWAGELVRELGVPGLGSYGVGRGHIPDLVAKATNASSMKANPISLTSAELAEVLTTAL